MVESNSRPTEEKWKNPGLCQLPETKSTFSLQFIDGVLAVAGHEVYKFLDGFSGYNQIRMHPVNQEKTTFVTEWGMFIAVVMMLGLKTTLATFQRIIREIFGEYIPTFMQAFLIVFQRRAM